MTYKRETYWVHSAPDAPVSGLELRLRSRLRTIPDLYERLELEAVEATPPPSERQSSGRSAPLPVPAAVLDHLILRFDNGSLDGLASLEGWCGVVIEAQQFTWPPPSDTVFGRLATACGFLGLHLSWVLTQPWVDDLNSEVGVIHRALRNAVEPDGRWQKTRLVCVQPLPPLGDDQPVPCGAGMYRDNLDAANPVLTCRQCQVSWDPPAWHVLAERQPRTQEGLPVRDVVVMLGHDRELRALIQQGKIPNYGEPGAPRVKYVECEAALKEYTRKRRKEPA